MPTEDALYLLGELLADQGYRFTTTTPTTHATVNARPGNEFARTLRDVFGWSRPFEPELLPKGMFELTCAAGACEKIAGTRLWRPTLRFSSLENLLFAHSAYPTDAQDAVFFGPDTHRFVRAMKSVAPRATRIVDVGCGSGVGGISLARLSQPPTPVVLSDVNESALRLARVNARLAGVDAEVVRSDILAGVSGAFDLVICNPPYLRDASARAYRDGGGELGEQVGKRVITESIARLREIPGGGELLLYTGALIADGVDRFLAAVAHDLDSRDVQFSYEELDPDVFSEELEKDGYEDADRIAAVFLRVHVHPNE